MFRFSSLSLVAVYAVSKVLAAPQTASPSPSICSGYQWGVLIQQLTTEPIPVYNQYLTSTACSGPASVSSSGAPTPPATFTAWGVTYECEIPETTYYCGDTAVATCCGEQA